MDSFDRLADALWTARPAPVEDPWDRWADLEAECLALAEAQRAKYGELYERAARATNRAGGRVF